MRILDVYPLIRQFFLFEILCMYARENEPIIVPDSLRIESRTPEEWL
jgi:hypothetical protein